MINKQRKQEVKEAGSKGDVPETEEKRVMEQYSDIPGLSSVFEVCDHRGGDILGPADFVLGIVSAGIAVLNI